MAKVIIDLEWHKYGDDEEIIALFAGELCLGYLETLPGKNGYWWGTYIGDHDPGMVDRIDNPLPESEAKAECEAFVIEQLKGTAG